MSIVWDYLKALAEFKSFTMKTVSSAYLVYRNTWSKMFRPETSFFDLIKARSTSNARMNRYTEMGSPFVAPLWSEKYFVVWRPFITHSEFSIKYLPSQ